MKFILITILLLFPLISASQDKEIILSPRIGNEINLYTKNYFNLFPMIDNFISAKLYTATSGNYSIKIKFGTSASPKDTAIIISDTLLNDLIFYIENFEDAYITENLNEKIKSSNFWSFVKPIVRYINSNSKILWDDFNNNSFKNYLLYAHNDYFIVWQSDHIYNWRKLTTNAKLIYFKEVEYLNFELINSDSIEFTNVLFSNKMKAAFQNFHNDSDFCIPPELLDFIEIELNAAKSKIYVSRPKPMPEIAHHETFLKLDSIALLLNFEFISKINTDNFILKTKLPCGDGNSSIKIKQPIQKYAINLSLFYDLNHYISSGLNLRYIIPEKINDFNQLKANDYSLGILFKLNFIKKMLLNAAYYNLKINYLFGINLKSVNLITDNIHIPSYILTVKGDDYQYTTTHLQTLALHSSINLQYYLRKDFAFECGIGFNWIPAKFKLYKDRFINVKCDWDEYPDTFEQTSNAVNLSEIVFRLGLSFYPFK
ncbi:MAG: hypothetical protein NT007_05265 [Candidatus Kapabacteria bacterium]|nr:hypothetical protein [Candidatus Kapabacteria bacterium]